MNSILWYFKKGTVGNSTEEKGAQSRVFKGTCWGFPVAVKVRESCYLQISNSTRKFDCQQILTNERAQSINLKAKSNFWGNPYNTIITNFRVISLILCWFTFEILHLVVESAIHMYVCFWELVYKKTNGWWVKTHLQFHSNAFPTFFLTFFLIFS